MTFDLDQFIQTTYKFPEVAWLSAREWLTHRLRQVAHDQGTTYYGDLCAEMKRVGVISLEPHGTPLAGLLGQINVVENDQNRPLLSAVVLSKETGAPGVGFWNISEQMGIDVGRTTDERERFWLESLRACHDYWKGRDPAGY
jgi:hypothetical protein